MKRLLLLISVFSLAISTHAQTNEVNMKTKIEHVTVFLSGAQIERSAKKQLNKGVYYLNFNGLSNNVNPNSIQVGGKGDLTILSVSNRKNYFNPIVSSPKVQLLKDSISILKDELWLQQEMKKVYRSERDMILANKKISPSGTTGFNANDVETLANLYRKRLTELMKLDMKITKNEVDLSKKISLLQSQINQLSTQKKYTTEIIVEVAVNRTTTANFDIKYMVNGASWKPSYDIRANGVDKPMELSYNAQVVQNTGINWEKVELSLSTNNPYVSPIKPSLSPWRLAFLPTYLKQSVDKKSNRRSNYEGYSGKNKVEEKSEAIQSNDMPDMSITTAQNWTTVAQSDLNYSFEISIPYNIPSDNKKHKVNVRNEKMETDFRYFTVPKKKTDAFLVGSVSDWEKLQLLSGSANIYLKGTFVGQSFIDTKNTKDTLQISLGVDQQLIVSRKRIEDFCKIKSVGSNKTETIGLEVTVKNTKMSAIKIIVEEQIPISTNSEIQIELLESTGAQYDEKTGYLTWKLELAPGESKNVIFKYQVKFPKDRRVNL